MPLAAGAALAAALAQPLARVVHDLPAPARITRAGVVACAAPPPRAAGTAHERPQASVGGRWRRRRPPAGRRSRRRGYGRAGRVRVDAAHTLAPHRWGVRRPCARVVCAMHVASWTCPDPRGEIGAISHLEPREAPGRLLAARGCPGGLGGGVRTASDASVALSSSSRRAHVYTCHFRMISRLCEIVRVVRVSHERPNAWYARYICSP